MTVENLLHIKKFSKNCLKSAILYNIKLYIKIYYDNVIQRSLGDYCKQSRHRGISIVTSYQVIIKLPYVTWFWYSTSYRMLYNDLKLILMAEILNWKAIHNLLCSISSNNTQVLRTWGGGFQEKGNWNLKGIISSNKIEFNKVNRKSFTVAKGNCTPWLSNNRTLCWRQIIKTKTFRSNQNKRTYTIYHNANWKSK